MAERVKLNPQQNAMLQEAVNIEAQIEALEENPNVLRAMRYNEIREKRIAYMQKLKRLERLGERLRYMEWDYDDAEDED